MSDYPMLISNKLHSFRNFGVQIYINLQLWHHYSLNLPAIFIKKSFSHVFYFHFHTFTDKLSLHLHQFYR